MWVIAIVPFYVLVFISFLLNSFAFIFITWILWFGVAYAITKDLPQDPKSYYPIKLKHSHSSGLVCNPIWAIFISIIIPILIYFLFVLID